MNRYIIKVLLLVTLCGSASGESLPDFEKENSAYVTYEAILYFTNKNQSNPYVAPFYIDGLMASLILNDHPKASELFVNLYDYYLGAAFGEQLNVYTSNYGGKLLEYLERKVGSASTCEKRDIQKLPKIKCSDVTNRDIRINQMIKVIKTGEPYGYIQ